MNNGANNPIEKASESANEFVSNLCSLALWKLVIITVLLPPIGAFLFSVRRDLPLWAKLLAAAYAMIVIMLLLSRFPSGEISVSASDIFID